MGKGQVEKVKKSWFGVRGHPNYWGAKLSRAKKTALGSEVKIGGERKGERESELWRGIDKVNVKHSMT